MNTWASPRAHVSPRLCCSLALHLRSPLTVVPITSRAQLEGRIILALVARSFDFQPAFDAVHELANDGSVYANDKGYRQGKQDVDGEEAFQILLGTAKPREGMPMRVVTTT